MSIPFLIRCSLRFLIILPFSYITVYGQNRNTIECIENGCDNIIGGGNRYLLSRTELQSDYDLEIARKLLKCTCLEKKGGEFKGLISRLQKMIDAYQNATSNNQKNTSSDNVEHTTRADSLINQKRDSLIGVAEKAISNARNYSELQNFDIDYRLKCVTFKCKEVIDSLVRKRRNELYAMEEQQKAQEDSLRKAEIPKEIAALLNKPGKLDECVSKCKEYSDQFGEEPGICKNAVAKKIKTLLPIKITSQELADIYFTPRTELTEWYMEGKQTGYVQIGGDVSWVSGNLAEVDMGSQFTFLIRFSSPWIVREGMTIMGYGKSIGNITYNTAMGGRRTLPCLKLVWAYRPSLDKNINSEE